ncbi:hypothetical protein [Rathayibacter sp. VKM Ac-2760]|uniref:hypothetical protein n=1 Tax=Rathayibacter sp. VKM Ac-2760 TaxID=2609253 RepID=UPI001318F0E4|nr:hypothetical protein [Rathayibacter sp. VKM Ac-2760]QHC59735.1 hypothetical protein GSU72_15130 [Rathayibacter sp. VKM Ac-2760]
MRLHHPILLVAAAALLTGCASGPVIDVPESATSADGSAAAPAVTAEAETPEPTAEPTVAPTEAAALDCGTALPAATVEAGAGLPAGTVELVQSGDVCSYGIAGNPSAVVVTVGPARLAETFVGAGEAVGAVSAPLGEAAYRLEGSTGAPSELAVLASGYELHVQSYVGEQDVLADWAVAVLGSLGVPLSAG